jgi:hypothetical protein
MSLFEDYIDQGFFLCPIPAGAKGPIAAGWNRKENAIRMVEHIDPNNNIGLLHAYSQTCAVDIDDVAQATTWLADHGVNLVELATAPDAVQISSGNPNHGKLIYRLGVPMASRKIVVDGKNIIDFRCMSATGTSVQDVLPPSLHPNGQQYRWIGDHTKIPMIPDALYEVWKSLANEQAPVHVTSTVNLLDMSIEKVRSLLAHIDAGCDRKSWIEIGMALHATSIPDIYHLFDLWSSKSTKYKGPQDTAAQWRSFTNLPNGIGVGTLYWRAIRGGWKPHVEEALALFKQQPIGFNAETLTDINQFLPELDLDIIPPRLARYAKEVAIKVGCNPIVTVISGLIAASAAADHRSTLDVFPGFRLHPVLWALLIADPGAKKSPGSKPMFEPLSIMEREDITRYKAKMLLWEAHEAAHAASKKAYLKKAESEEWRYGNEVLPEVSELPAAPRPLRLTFTDATSQKAVRMLDGRPGGMCLLMDEAGGWLTRVVSANSGEDRSFWTVSYESGEYTFDRVGTGSIRLDNLSLSIYGNVQTNVIDNLIDQMQTDGFSQRFLPIFIPTETQSCCSEEIDEWMSNSAEWDSVLREIHSNGERHYRIDAEGQSAFKNFEAKVEKMKRVESLIMSPAGLQSSISKFTGLLGRLSLVFHMIENPGQTVVPVETIKKAQLFIEDYLIFNLRKLYSMGGGEHLGLWVFNWILSGTEVTVTEGDVRHAARRQIGGRSTHEQKDLITMHMGYLASKNVVMEISPATGMRQAVYAINPLIREKYASRREAIIQANKERNEHIEMVVATSGKRLLKQRGLRGE